VTENSDAEFLRADFQHLCESLLRNEELGEKRVAAFVTLGGAFFAALGFVADKLPPAALPSAEAAAADEGVGAAVGLGVSLHGAATFLSSVLLALGLLTLLRVVRRNAATDGYIGAMNAIRQELLGERAAIYTQYLAKGSRGLLNGGQAYIVAVMNVALVVVLTWAASLGRAPLISLASSAFLAAIVQYAIAGERAPTEGRPR
jgi:hypothetical protein